jgi:hypothetical protein
MTRTAGHYPRTYQQEGIVMIRRLEVTLCKPYLCCDVAGCNANTTSILVLFRAHRIFLSYFSCLIDLLDKQPSNLISQVLGILHPQPDQAGCAMAHGVHGWQPQLQQFLVSPTLHLRGGWSTRGRATLCSHISFWCESRAVLISPSSRLAQSCALVGAVMQ